MLLRIGVLAVTRDYRAPFDHVARDDNLALRISKAIEITVNEPRNFDRIVVFQSVAVVVEVIAKLRLQRTHG